MESRRGELSDLQDKRCDDQAVSKQMDGLVDAEGGGRRDDVAPAGTGSQGGGDKPSASTTGHGGCCGENVSEMRERKAKGNLFYTRIHNLHYVCKWASYGFERTKWHGSNNCKIVMTPT
jgi:hypothetical protein